MITTKQEAKRAFGSYKALCEELGISRAALWKWKDVLNKRQRNEVNGAYLARKQRRLKELLCDDDLLNNEDN